MTLWIVDKNDQEIYDKYLNAQVDKDWDNKHVYELYGIVCHSGSMGGGHYVAYVNYK